MLVLTRKQNESIQIGKDVSIVVMRVQGGRVRLGITAPAGVRVLRSELAVEEDKDEVDSPQASRSTADKNSDLSRSDASLGYRYQTAFGRAV